MQRLRECAHALFKRTPVNSVVFLLQGVTQYEFDGATAHNGLRKFRLRS